MGAENVVLSCLDFAPGAPDILPQPSELLTEIQKSAGRILFYLSSMYPLVNIWRKLVRLLSKV